jgi:cell division protein FtsZ
VKTIMAGMGMATMGTGIAEGENRAMEAAKRAISSPLLEGASVAGARGVIINVTGGPDLSLIEVSEASSIIQEAAHEDANIIFGAVIDGSLEHRVKITVIATGFDRPGAMRSNAASASQTPVDLQDYTTRLRAPAQSIDVAAASRAAFTRRPSMELPTAMAVGAEDQAPRDEGETAFDVPAFLRRQSE